MKKPTISFKVENKYGLWVTNKRGDIYLRRHTWHEFVKVKPERLTQIRLKNPSCVPCGVLKCSMAKRNANFNYGRVSRLASSKFHTKHTLEVESTSSSSSEGSILSPKSM